MGDDLQAHGAAAGHRSTIGLSVAHLNARSLFISDKFNEISALILSNAFDIFAVSETWLNANTVEPLLSGPPLSGHPLLNGQMSKSQKYLLYIIKDTTSIKRPPLLSGHGHLRAVRNSVFINYNLF